MSSLRPDHASLCFLSFNRPQFIFEAIRDAVAHAGYPCEVIVHDDGSDAGLLVGLLDMLAGHEVSRLILNPPGHNEGVGTAINRMFKVATGDPVIKLDQDLLFEPDWLARAVGILRQDSAVGMLGLFKYHHEPVPWQRMRIDVPTKGGYHYTRQFCGSAFAIPRRVWETLGPLEEHSDAFAEDSAYMERVRTTDFSPPGSLVSGRRELALPDVDLCHNRGFGIGPSTVVTAPDTTQSIHHGPFVLNAKTPPPQNGVISGEPADTHEFEVPMLAKPERKFEVGVVITTCAGREENLQRTIDHLMRAAAIRQAPQAVVVVYDGCPAMGFPTPIPVHGVEISQHVPGQEQPRNVGFRKLREVSPDCNFVWFLDSDLIFEPDILRQFYNGLTEAEDRILIGPYDWLAPQVVEPVHDRSDHRVGMADYRWVSFDEHGPERVLRHDLGAGLACFGGNLVWPVDAFEKIGGFHPELHHGRCEDGELGLRAASAGVPMSFVREARGWHVFHPVNGTRTHAANARDVPLINQWHPWVEGQGLLVTAQDGARFDFRCPQCGDQVNSLAYWDHTATHKEN